MYLPIFNSPLVTKEENFVAQAEDLHDNLSGALRVTK